MGFFRSNKSGTAPPPLPNLKLHLADDPNRVFKPNDTVAGHISFSTSVPLNPQAIECSFWGQSQTWIRISHSSGNNSTTYTHYRDIAPLFTVTLNVLPKPGETLLPDRVYEYPFSFRVPEGTATDRIADFETPSDERWTTHPHPLPPTIFHGTIDPENPERPNNCAVSYGVTATLLCPGVGLGKHQEDPVSVTGNILFQPQNPNIGQSPSVLKYPKQFVLQSTSLTGADPKSLSFKQRLHDRLSSSTPRLGFELAIEIPDLLTAGQEFQFRTAFRVLEKSDSVVRIPTVCFRIQKLELTEHTFFRGPRDWNASSNMRGTPRHYAPSLAQRSGRISERDVYSEIRHPLNPLPPFVELELEEEAVLGEKDKKTLQQRGECEFWFKARVPSQTKPNFVSFAISRGYRLRVKLEVEIGEKRFQHEGDSYVRCLGGAA